MLRIYSIYFIVCIIAFVIVGKLIQIQFIEGDALREKSKIFSLRYKNIEATRGNIIASDGSLLATSVPIYEIRMDVMSDALTDEVFYSGLDSLSMCLSELFKDKTPKQYKKYIIKARKSDERYLLLKRGARYDEMIKLKTFPLFRLGRYKGGFIAILDTKKREHPYDMLAARTIGFYRENYRVGIEGAFNEYLEGVSGKRLMQRIAPDVWMPVNDEEEIESKDGCDIITTIDVNFQDVAENSLLKQMDSVKADYGCVVLMEVKTGEIKSIVNLSRDKNGKCIEVDNYATRVRSDPGSTFKLMSMVAAMEDGCVKDLNEKFDIGSGKYIFGKGDTVRDSHEAAYGIKTIEEIFEMSSNVGVAKIIDKYYRNNKKKYYNRLMKMGLGDTLSIDIEEKAPLLKPPPYPDVSLHRMAYGYEVELTPLQILTFYNAIANGGVKVRPMLVKEIRQTGKVIKKVKPEILNEKMCSKETVEKAKEMLEGVVQKGTARNLLKNFHIKIAGKTGTAKVIENGKYVKKYRSSFVGYFPADNPLYSCIVVINNPQGVYYGSLVAGPVFKEIAEKVYSNRFELHDEIDTNKNVKLPVAKAGYQNDILKIYSKLGYNCKPVYSAWVVPSVKDSIIDFLPKIISKNVVPNVVGMDIQNAIFILESKGLKVKFQGKGIVKNQSVESGTKIIKGSQIRLTLSNEV
ncbi:MAG: penicillin-binding protein [Bacteroidales bacterium]